MNGMSRQGFCELIAGAIAMTAFGAPAAEDGARSLVPATPSKVDLKRGSVRIPGSVARELCPPLNEFDTSEPVIEVVVRKADGR